jgi:hypothetical protein
MSDNTTGPDREFLEGTVKSIVDNPNDVIITRTVDDLGVLITLQVNKDDMSKIIGRSGRTAKALRTLLRVVGAKHELRVNLKVLEPDGSEYRVQDDEGEARPPRREREPRREHAPRREEAAPAAPTNESEGNAATSAFDDII